MGRETVRLYPWTGTRSNLRSDTQRFQKSLEKKALPMLMGTVFSDPPGFLASHWTFLGQPRPQIRERHTCESKARTAGTVCLMLRALISHRHAQHIQASCYYIRALYIDPQASPVLSQPRLVCVLLGLRESVRNGLCCDSGAAGLEGKAWVKGNKG